MTGDDGSPARGTIKPVSRRALITGIAGQDGSLLAELLLERGYDVIGIVRDLEEPRPNLEELEAQIELSDVDLTDSGAVIGALQRWQPTEVYNLAAVTFVPLGWENPLPVARVGVVAFTLLLEAIRRVTPTARVAQASSAEMFGDPTHSPQNESTPIAPLTPYGIAKAYAHFLTGAYRRKHGLHASSAILFNHTSPRRPVEFVTRKIAQAAAQAKLGRLDQLVLGNLDARRDWGDARDHVRAMWLMLQVDEPGDYVVATGEAHSVRELAELAFAYVGLDWREYVRTDEALDRTGTEALELVGDASKAQRCLGWEPTIGFEELVRTMVDADLDRLRSGLELSRPASAEP